MSSKQWSAHDAAALLKNALARAAQGRNVFPLGDDKRPVTENGFKDASTDPVKIERMFANPRARLIGVATGAVSGIDVLDVDPNGKEWAAQNWSRLGKTRTQRTRRDGFHMFFKHREGVRSSAGKIAEGIDIRGDGGYIADWGPAGFPLYDDSPIADMPEWLFEAITSAKAVLTKHGPKPPQSPEDLTPTSADAVIALLALMPNPAEVGRDTYVAVNLAVQGLIRGGLALDVINDDQADAIKDAAAEWAARWEGPNASDYAQERARWDDDWSLRENDVSGWRNLLGIAGGLGVDVSEHLAALAADEFSRVPLPPEVPYVPAAVSAGSGRKPTLLSIADLEAMPEPTWLVAGLLQSGTLAVAFGPPKHGKTFVVLSLGLHVAAGLDWFGRPVCQGGVVYIAGEGAGGLKWRVLAACRAYGIPATVPFWIIPRAVNFSDAKAVEDLIRLIPEATGGARISLVVVDTLARAMPGVDENSAGEVGKVIASCDHLKEKLGCTVMPVHHQGKDGEKGMRGSSAIAGAVDSAFQVVRDKSVPGADVVSLATIFQKDAEEGPPILLDLMSVEAAPGRTSLVPMLRAGTAPSADKLTPQQNAALAVLLALLAESGSGAVAESAWRNRCVEGRAVSASETEKTRREAFKTAFEALVRRNRVEADGHSVRLVGGGMAESRRNPAYSATARPRSAAEEAEEPYRAPPSAASDAPFSLINDGSTRAKDIGAELRKLVG